MCKSLHEFVHILTGVVLNLMHQQPSNDTFLAGSESILSSVSDSASSSGVVSVCPGKQLRLVCTVNHSNFLTWVIPQTWNTTIAAQPLTKNIPYTGMRNLSSIRINDTKSNVVAFHFTRTSEERSLPLIAELIIDRVSISLNGTDVHCLPAVNDSDHPYTFSIQVLGGWW